MLLATTLLFAIVTDPASHNADLIHVNHPLGAVLGSGSTNSVYLAPLPMDPATESGNPSLAPSGGNRRISADRVIDLVRRVVAPDEWDAPGRSIDIATRGQNRLLSVTAPAAVQDDIAKALRYIASHVQRDIRIRCDAYSIGSDGGDLAGFVGARDAAERAKSRANQGDFEAVFGATLRCVAGMPVFTSRTTDRSYLIDYAVEVAQTAAIHDPIVKSAVLGTALAIRAEVLSANEVVMHFGIRHAYEAAPPRVVDASADVQLSIESRTMFENRSPGTIEAPTIAFETLSGAARLEKGVPSVAFVAPLSSGDYDDRGLLVVFTLESVGEASPAFTVGSNSLAIVDLAAHFDPQVSIATVAALAGSSRGYDQQEWEGLTSPIAIPAAAAPEHPHPEADALLNYATLLLVSDNTSFEMEAGYAFIIGQSSAADLATRLTAVCSAPISTATLVGTAASAADENERRAVFAMPLAGSRFLAIDGIEENLLMDADVEVANGCAIADPTTITILTGRCVQAAISAESNAEIVAVSGFGRSRISPIESQHHRTAGSPILERARFAASRFAADLRFAANAGAQRIDGFAPDGEGASFDLDLRVVKR
jgi:hypothetical protein